MNQLLFITADRCGVRDKTSIVDIVRQARCSRQPVIDHFLESGLFEERPFLYNLSQNLLRSWWEPEPSWHWDSRLAWLASRDLAMQRSFVPIGFANDNSGAIHLATYNSLDTVSAQEVANAYRAPVYLHCTTRSVVQEGQQRVFGA